MIPKKIHYCWFGGNEKSELILKCLDSWKKYAPDYEIIEWNESNYSVNKFKYSMQAYELEKYAFVSDAARFDILYQEGGVYLDTDVELIKPIDDFLVNDLFMGYDQKGLIASGLILGSVANNNIIGEIRDFYSNNYFLNRNGRPNTTTVVTIVSDILKNNGFELDGKLKIDDGVALYPWNYFDPYDYEENVLKVTKDTISIHHYSASWKSKSDLYVYKIGRIIKMIVGNKMYDKIARIKHKLFG